MVYMDKFNSLYRKLWMLGKRYDGTDLYNWFVNGIEDKTHEQDIYWARCQGLNLRQLQVLIRSTTLHAVQQKSAKEAVLCRYQTQTSASSQKRKDNASSTDTKYFSNTSRNKNKKQ
mgnify:CR=1 FL=1